MSLLRRRLMMQADTRYIHFEDPEVERICLENWDKDGDGRLSKEEARQVSSVDVFFKKPNVIENLDCRCFVSVRAMDFWATLNFPTVKHFYLPPNIERVGVHTIHTPNAIVVTGDKIREFHLGRNAAKFADIIVLNSKIVPKNNYTMFGDNVRILYVRDDLTESFRTTPPWATIADKIHPVSEYENV